MEIPDKARAQRGGPVDESHAHLIRPVAQDKPPPCGMVCPGGVDIRGWTAWIAQREKLGLDREEAYTRAWRHLVESNPLPAVLGRVCPHPCETACNRTEKDGAVSIHAMERFIGDWGLRRQLPLPRSDGPRGRASVGVIGAGPAGLSCAYQMARLGYAVTVYEQHPHAGGMLRYGIPEYRLPRDILDGEIRRIEALGVRIHTDIRIGQDICIARLRERHAAFFVGIGADKPRQLGIPGEDGGGVLAGTNFLYRVNQGHSIQLGSRVVVIGGGNTAIDAARAARRLGAEVRLLYRRTRADMPATGEEIDEALAEGVDMRFLVAPMAVLREADEVRGLRVQRMQVGEPDSSGRHAPLPLAGDSFEMPADTLIAAVSQQPDWDDLADFSPDAAKQEIDASGRLGRDVWTGGDTLGLGTVSRAIGHGRTAAAAMHAQLLGIAPGSPLQGRPVTDDQMHLDYYAASGQVALPVRPQAEWLTKPSMEIHRDISEEQFLKEASRCLSCGSCFGCGHCWMYCNPGGYSRRESTAPGAYFDFDASKCEGCGKCIDLCPCGFLSPAAEP